MFKNVVDIFFNKDFKNVDIRKVREIKELKLENTTNKYVKKIYKEIKFKAFLGENYHKIKLGNFPNNDALINALAFFENKGFEVKKGINNLFIISW